MLYIVYEEYKLKFYEAQQQYNDILNEKEKLFVKTQPKATTFDKERVDGGNRRNSFDDYVIIKEKKQIDQRLNEIKSILDDREKLLKLKEEELKASKHIYDRIYVYRYMNRLTGKKIANLIPCGDATVFRILKKIKKNIN